MKVKFNEDKEDKDGVFLDNENFSREEVSTFSKENESVKSPEV